MKILLDTNILLDVALRREPFFADSAAVLTWAEQNPGHAAIAWHSIANLAYLVKQDARAFIADLLEFAEVGAGDARAVRQALRMPTRDLEDALQASAAIEFGADMIVTRDIQDFKRLTISPITPEQFAKRFCKSQ